MKRVRNGYNAARMIADCWGLHPNWARDRQDRWDKPLQHFEWTELQGAIYELLESQPVKPPTLGQVIQNANINRKVEASRQQEQQQGCKRCAGTGHLTCIQHVVRYDTREVLKIAQAVVACDCPKGQVFHAQGGLKEWRQAAEQYSTPRDVNLYVTGTSYRMNRLDTVETSPWFASPSPEEETGNPDVDRAQWTQPSAAAAAQIEAAASSSPELSKVERIRLVDERGY